MTGDTSIARRIALAVGIGCYLLALVAIIVMVAEYLGWVRVDPLVAMSVALLAVGIAPALLAAASGGN